MPGYIRGLPVGATVVREKRPRRWMSTAVPTDQFGQDITALEALHRQYADWPRSSGRAGAY